MKKLVALTLASLMLLAGCSSTPKNEMCIRDRCWRRILRCSRSIWISRRRSVDCWSAITNINCVFPDKQTGNGCWTKLENLYFNQAVSQAKSMAAEQVSNKKTGVWRWLRSDEARKTSVLYWKVQQKHLDFIQKRDHFYAENAFAVWSEILKKEKSFYRRFRS